MSPPPPNYDFQQWWNRERERAHLLPHSDGLLPPEPSAAASSAVASPDPDAGKGRGRSSRQLRWLILLRIRRAAAVLAALPSRFLSLLLAGAHRAASSPSDRPDSRLYRLVRAFLVLAVVLLIVELAAYSKGWHFSPPSFASSAAALERLYAYWLLLRADYLAPPVQFIANFCTALFLIQSADRLALMIGCLWIKLRRLRPIAGVEYGEGDVEAAEVYPMVLVQIPMCNEREVYQQSIAAVCTQDWPRDRMLVQILDDSDDVEVQLIIKAEVQKWQQKGVNILYRHRFVRTGYKAGNLKSAMSCDYVKDYEFVAIFDADFQPGTDFLKKTIPHFKGNDDLALVQTRWAFVNKDENLLTRLQNINLSFHFEVEQQVNGMFINFFGFNGTAGVWRIKALEESGGWLERTTVEDMDIAVRAHLAGWKFIYLNDVKCLCELPESYGAYKKQQHRWHSGPMQLFRLCFFDILRSKAIGLEGDVRKREDAARVLEATFKHFGRLDILVNGAAGNFLASPEDLSPNAFRTVLDIDSVGTYTMCHEALKYLKKGGVILNISATLHYTAYWYQLHVSAAKAAVDSITRSLALEWGTDYEIRVNGIAPGPIGDTPGHQKLAPKEMTSRIREYMPLYRVGERWDVAMAALYLASDAGKFINGTTLVLDGGLWLCRPRHIPKEEVKNLSRALERKSRASVSGIPTSKL